MASDPSVTLRGPMSTGKREEEALRSRKTLTVAEAMAKIPTVEGKRFAPIFEHGSLQVEIYAPHGVDPQSPRDRDEIYVSLPTHGTFSSGAGRVRFERGDVHFAAAGGIHCLESVTKQLSH